MKQVKHNTQIPAGLGIGLLVSAVLTIVLACILSWFIHSDKIAEATLGYGVLGILVISTISGAAVASALVQTRKLVVCCISGACYMILLLSCTALFFDGRYEGVGATILTILCCAIATGLVVVKGGKTQKRRTYKMRNR